MHTLLPIPSHINFIQVITNCNTNNFGYVIGKNGNMIKKLQEMYNVHIIVPISEYDFPHIIIVKNRTGISDINGAQKAIIELLIK